LKLIFGMF